MLIITRCSNCGTSHIYKNNISYELNVKKFGKTETCPTCGHTNIHESNYNFTFCSYKCLLEFLKNHKDEDYKHLWEVFSQTVDKHEK